MFSVAPSFAMLPKEYSPARVFFFGKKLSSTGRLCRVQQFSGLVRGVGRHWCATQVLDDGR